jgi:DNA ligase-1
MLEDAEGKIINKEQKTKDKGQINMRRQLYKKDTKGKVRTLVLTAVDFNLIQEAGLLDGKWTTNVRVCTPKNVGRSNETTGEEQALLELESVATRKLREGYFETIEEAENNEVLLPMLAVKADMTTVTYPVFVQPKLDGMRALSSDKGLYSRKNKMIETMQHIELPTKTDVVLDGELYAHGATFQDNMKLIKKFRPGQTEDVKYHVYDMPSAPGGFADRYLMLREVVKNMCNVELVPTYIVNNEEELLTLHTKFISEGFEGTIIRTDNTPYEYNKRSKQLLKLKDFIDEAYKIIDVVPSDRIPKQGVVVCKMKDGQTFRCGMKMSHEEREDILSNKEEIIGKTAEVRFFEYTDGGLPRFPVFYGVRLDK